MAALGDPLQHSIVMSDGAFGTATERVPTGTVTFLLTDISGSTRLWEAGADAAAAAVHRHYELLSAAIALHNGVRPVEQGEGDSVVAAFAKPSDALAAALDVQRAFVDESWPEGRAVQVRIALHTGEAQLRDESNYFGPTIIRCARLRAIAHGGQTLLSHSTRDLVVDQLDEATTLRDLGSHRLKDLGRAEQVWQLCHPDLDNDFPQLRSLDAVPNNLPVPLTTLVAREAELAQLCDALEHYRLVTLIGSGGCGKTRLALHAAGATVERHRDGVWWIELGPLSDPEQLATVVASALGLREEAGRPVVDTLADQLAGRAALLVLDNCEQVLGACAELVATLLGRTTHLRVVATSREPLGVPGELAWRVPSLDDDAACRLFIERAREARPTFAPDAEQLAVVGQICRRLDGLPLAIELAAARTRMMHPARIASALDDRFRLLTGGSRTVMPRQQTLEASVAWSYGLLDDDERVLMRRLSVFAGGFSLDAAEEVCADESLDGYAVLDLIGRLVDKSLVQADHGDGETRYRLLETIRHYARQKLVEADEVDATRDRHLAYFLALAARAEPELAAEIGVAWLDRLDTEDDNVRAALDWADSVERHEAFLRMVVALTLFWELRGHLGAGGRWFQRALAHDAGPSVARARALWGAAHVALYSDDFETAAQRAPEALAMAEAVGDQWAVARALNTLGYLQLWSDPSAARLGLEQSIDLGQGIGDHWAVADGLKMLTVSWLVQDDGEGGRAARDELLRVAERLGNQFFIAWYHCAEGYAALHKGDLDAAHRSLETSFEHCNEVGEPATGGLAVQWLAERELMIREYDAGRARLEAFLQRAAATGGAVAVPGSVIVLATLALAFGDEPTCREMLEPLVAEMRVLEMHLYTSWGLNVLGAAYALTDDDEAARRAFAEAHDLATLLGNDWLAALAEHNLAELEHRGGHLHRAEDLHHEALARRLQHNLLPGVIESVEAVAAVAVAQESGAEAVRLLAAAAAGRESLGLARWPIRQPAHDGAMARARELLDPEAFEKAWAEGASLTIEEAVVYASRARGERKRPTAGWDSLTPTEERVVALVVEGMTNPQIAERLFITRGTVKVHLGHVFAKLGMSTRAELAAHAARRALEQ